MGFKREGPNKSNIRKWAGFYSRFGKTGFLPRKNQNYSTDFKLKVFKYIDNNYLSLKGTCLKFNITSAVRRVLNKAHTLYEVS